MKLGVSTQGFVLRDGDAGERIRGIVKEAQLADEVGLHSFGVSEQHFKFPTNSSPSVDVILTHVAATTENIRLRPGVVILPLHHPLDVAERWATLDVLSNGRVDFAVGRGNTSLTAAVYGIPMKDTGARTKEALEVVISSWRDPIVEYHGDFFDFPPIAVTPKPVQEPTPPIFWAATSPDAHAAGGEMGLGLMTGGTATFWDQSARRITRYRDAVASATPFPGIEPLDYVVMHVMGHCAPTREQAREEVGEYMVGYVNRAVEMYMKTVKASGKDVSFDRAFQLHNDLDAILANTPTVLGNPDECIEILARVNDLGVDELDITIDGGTHEQHLASIRLLGEIVAPAVAEFSSVRKPDAGLLERPKAAAEVTR